MMSNPRSDSRGQIIVIAALLIAMLLVGLALVLNSTIYAENIATRGETSTSDAMVPDEITQKRIVRAVDDVNYAVEEATYGERASWVGENVSDWDGIVGERRARKGQAYAAELTVVTNGTRVNQSTMDDFMPQDPRIIEDLMDERLDPFGISDRTNWLVAPDVQSRDFEVTVKRQSLQTIDSGVLGDISDLLNALLTGSETFWIQFDDGSGKWRVYVVEIQGTGEVAAVVTKNTGGGEVSEGVCRVEGDTVTIRLNEEEIEGDNGPISCRPFSFTNTLDRHDIYYGGADDVTGRYQYLVDREEQSFRDAVEANYDNLINSLIGVVDCVLRPWLCNPTLYEDAPNPDHPYTTTAVYSVSVRTDYRDDRIRHQRNVTYPASAR